MAATNRSAWVHNYAGRDAPIRHQFPAALGQTRTFKRGEILFMDTGDSDLEAVSQHTDNLHALVVADEEQRLSDPERMVWCIIPTCFDVFEFDLDTATEIWWGAPLQIVDSRTLKVTHDFENVIAGVAPVDTEDQNTNRPTVTRARVIFRAPGKSGCGAELPLMGFCTGDSE